MTGKAEQHDYEFYLDLNDITHTKVIESAVTQNNLQALSLN